MKLFTLFDYQIWADELVISFLDPVSEKERMHLFKNYTSIKDRINHIIMALETWYERLNGSSPHRLPNYMDQTTDQMIAKWRELDTRLHTFFSENHPLKFKYKNSKGQSFVDEIEDIGLHIINHTSTYRSQIIMMIRMLGYSVESTDYIYYIRQH